eukprot:1158006-Pelagomonas_calceolata.AAC.2
MLARFTIDSLLAYKWFSRKRKKAYVIFVEPQEISSHAHNSLSSQSQVIHDGMHTHTPRTRQGSGHGNLLGNMKDVSASRSPGWHISGFCSVYEMH